jgi:hypothetical protein
MNRTLTCTFSALLAGFLGAYIGGQITLNLYSQKCPNQPWGVKEICNAALTPSAIWQGSSTGIWMGTVLGAFVSGLKTRKSRS